MARARLAGSLRARVVLSLVFSILLYAVLWLLVRPVFATIDDARLLYVYAGYASGTPTGVYLFSNSLWGCLLAGLYTIAPFVPWYALYHFVAIVTLSTVLVSVLLSWGMGGRCRAVAAALLYIAFFFSTFALPSTILHFETAACMFGVAGNIILLLTDFKGPRKTFLCRAAVALVLLVLCYWQEKNTFYVEACLFTAVMLFKVLDAWRGVGRGPTLTRTIARVAVVAGILISSVLLSSAINQCMRSEAGWDPYEEYNPYRIAFWDYPHVTFEEDPELFESLGWDEGFYELVTSKMYFMDERFSVESLSQIVEPFDRAIPEISRESLASAWTTVESLVDSEPTVVAQGVLVAFVFAYVGFLLCLRGCRLSPRQRLCALFLACWTLLSLLLLVYLALRGRLPLRAWDAVTIPTVTLSIVVLTMLAGRYPAHSADRGAMRQSRIALAMVAAITAVVSSGVFASDFPGYRSDIAWRHGINESVQQVESYAAEHPDDMFITDINYQNYNPFSQKTVKPTNVLAWGSSYLYTPVYYQQLQTNGFGSLLSDSFLEGDVFYVSNMGRIETGYKLLNMLKRFYGVCSFELVSEVDDTFSVLEAVPFPVRTGGLQYVFGQCYVYSSGSPVVGAAECGGFDLSMSEEGFSCEFAGRVLYQTSLGTVVPIEEPGEDGSEDNAEKGMLANE